MGHSLELLRTTLEERLAGVVAAATPPPAPAAAPTVGIETLGTQLGDGLRALGADLSRAVGAAQGAATAGKVDSLSHELEMIHSTLASLKDLASQQRDHLRAVDGFQPFVANHLRQHGRPAQAPSRRHRRRDAEQIHRIFRRDQSLERGRCIHVAGTNADERRVLGRETRDLAVA